jgi:hypothetical protein
MRFLALSLALCAIPAAGQTFTLGTSSDPCTGGQPLAIVNSTSTVRWGDFTCTFPVSDQGPYVVEFDVLEPCAQPGACAAGQVTKKGQRVQNIYANDAPVITSLDSFTAGATDTTMASRTVLVFASANQIVVRVQTVSRSGILARVVISPISLNPRDAPCPPAPPPA